MILAWMRSDFMAIRDERPTWTLFYERAREPLSPKCALEAKRLLEATQTLLDEGLGSEPWSLAQTDLAFMLSRLTLNGHEVSPSIARFIDEQWRRPSVRTFVERKRAPYIPY